MPSFFIRWVPRIVYMLGWWNCRLLNKHICLPGTAWMGQEPVVSWDCGGGRLPPASLSMRPADLFIVGSDGFHKPNGTDTPLMIQACTQPRSAVSRHCTTTQNHTAHSTNMPEFCFLSSPLLVLYKKKKSFTQNGILSSLFIFLLECNYFIFRKAQQISRKQHV